MDSTGPSDERLANEPLVMAWRGGDPIAASRILAALRPAHISAFPKATHDHLVFGMAMPRPLYEILVLRCDYETANYLITPIQQEPPFAPFEHTGEEPPSPESAVANAASLKHRRWHPQQATEVIWSGDDPGLAEMLSQCLTENAIPFHMLGPTEGRRQLFVRAEEVVPAREIVREVLEGTPPA